MGTILRLAEEVLGARRDRLSRRHPPSAAFRLRWRAGVSDDDEWTPDDVASMIANPFYAINIYEGLALPHEPLISDLSSA